MPTIGSVNFTEIEQVLSTLYPPTSQVQSLEASILNDTSGDYEGMENVANENEVRPLISKTDSVLKMVRQHPAQRHPEILSSARTEGAIQHLSLFPGPGHPQKIRHTVGQKKSSPVDYSL